MRALPSSSHASAATATRRSTSAPLVVRAPPLSVTSSNGAPSRHHDHRRHLCSSLSCSAVSGDDVNNNNINAADAANIEREIRGVFSGSSVRIASSDLTYTFRDVASAEVYAFDVEAVAGPQLAQATRACAVRAARRVFGDDRLPDAEAAYRAALDATLPAVVFPYESAILARLLVDEGLVDFGVLDQEDQEEEEEPQQQAEVAAAAAAAAAGVSRGAQQQQQEQQRPPKQQQQRRPSPPSTTRPLLPAEIVEHWEEVRATCLQRWAREGEQTPADVDEALRAAFLDAQLEFAFPAIAGPADAPSSSSSPSASSDSDDVVGSRISRFGPRRAAAAAAATAAAAAASATLARAVSEAPDLVYVLCAGHARKVAAEALSRAGVGSGAGNRRGKALSAARRCVPVYAPSLEAAAERALDLQDARDRVRFVFDRPSRAERVRAHLAALEQEREEDAQQQPQQPEQQVAPLRLRDRATVHVAEGTCAAASHRAAAAASGTLLSEREMLEGMGVAESAAVMDGVDWRRRSG